MVIVLIFAVVLIVFAVGSVIFHLVSPWWWTPIASNWGYIDDTVTLTFWITGVAYVAIILFMAYCVVRYRHRPERRAHYEPENKKMEIWLTVATALGVAGMLAPGLFVWGQYVTVPKGAAVFEAVGQQWQWSYRFPGKDGVLGTTHARHVSGDNPFGLNPHDPKGQDDVLIAGDNLHIPIGKPVKVLLRSIDVLHDFYVPQFRAKMDLVPGMVTYFWLTPTRTGEFDILCFELCGVGHHAMRSKVVVEEESAFQAWLQEQQTFKQSLAKAGTGTRVTLTKVAPDDGSESGMRGEARSAPDRATRTD